MSKSAVELASTLGIPVKDAVLLGNGATSGVSLGALQTLGDQTEITDLLNKIENNKQQTRDSISNFNGYRHDDQSGTLSPPMSPEDLARLNDFLDYSKEHPCLDPDGSKRRDLLDDSEDQRLKDEQARLEAEWEAMQDAIENAHRTGVRILMAAG